MRLVSRGLVRSLGILGRGKELKCEVEVEEGREKLGWGDFGGAWLLILLRGV